MKDPLCPWTPFWERRNSDHRMQAQEDIYCSHRRTRWCCNRRSSGCGCCSSSPGCCGLHWGRNCSSIHSSQDDVSSSDRQWGWSCSRKPGSHTAVSGGCWTLYIIQHHPGLCWSSCWSLALNLGDDTSNRETQRP